MWNIGDYAYSTDLRQLCRIIEAQMLWGEMLYRVWLPNQDTMVRVRADRLKPLQEAGTSSCDSIIYVAAAARVADALTHDVLLAPTGASIIPLPHQLQALSRAMINDRVRYLLADEVGLGKTIEAGLIMRELKLRGAVQRTLVVAPRGLVTQWVAEMHTHFGETFQLLAPSDFAMYRRMAQEENIWRAFPQVVCPLDSVKPLDSRRGWSREQVAEYNRERFEDLIAAGWDLVVVDEAHRLGGSTDQVARYKLGQGLAEAAPYCLLLSATPHQGKTDAFHRLIALLDTQAFPDIASITRERVQPYVIRTEKRRAIDAEGHPLFKPRRTQLVPVAWQDRHREQRRLYDAVTEYVREGYNAVAQKSPCEGNRVIMGKESLLTLGQRGPDARQEGPMRTPKQLYAHERLIYQPELLTCPHCGDLLVTCNYLAWDKTVQMLDRVLSVASRPSRCPHATCVGSRLRLLSAAGQRIAPAGSTYGYDVVVRIGWWRQETRATYREMHAALASQVRISESHVGYLYQQVYLPLLACHERQHRPRLAQIAQQQGGLIVALDGLAPQGGEPQIWFIRELTSGVTLRSGWLAQQDQPTFEAFLKPLTRLEWPILAVLSDKQTGLVPAVATVFPKSRYQFCQAHYLRNLAEPLAEADGVLKGELRQTVRQQVGDLIRQEARTASGPSGVLTVTGLLPSPLAQPTAPVSHTPPPRRPLTAREATADEVITQLLRHTRYLLTLKGRPPFRLAGLETYERLQNVAQLSLALLATRYDPRLAQLYQGLQVALTPFAETYDTLRHGAAWLRDIAYILEPCPTQPMSADQVAGQLRSYLDTVRQWPSLTPALCAFGRHLDKVSQSYWPGLFHCYDVPGLPRTNNALESHFRETGRRLLRITGQKGLTQRTLQRQGAWELLLRPPTEAQVLDAVGQIPREDLVQERQRFAAHRQRFRLQSRSLRQTQAQFNQLRQQWSTLQPTGTG